MNERYDMRGAGRAGDGGGADLDVRELLEGASWTGREGVLDPDDHWAAGRRRRGRKRAGAGALGVTAVVAVAGLLWQAGVPGGQAGAEPAPGMLPSGMTTFVLAAPDAPATDPETLSALRVPTAEELLGTTWVLTDDVWSSDLSTSEVVGARADTEFSFSEQSWGFTADDCGGGGAQGPVQLTADGAFGPTDLATLDQGCPEPAQTAEDFWIDTLSQGGSLHLVGDGGWLLLSVDPAQAGREEPPAVVVPGAARLSFVREGVDPAGVELSGAERVPSNEELAGTSWVLTEWVDGGAALADLVDDPGRLRLRWAEDWPGTMTLAYGSCDLVTLRTEGVDADGGTVPPEGVAAVQEAAEPCAGAEAAGPALAESLTKRVQVTLIGQDVLVLHLPLPARDDAAQTEAPAQTEGPARTTSPADATGGPVEGAAPPAATDGGSAQPTGTGAQPTGGVTQPAGEDATPPATAGEEPAEPGVEGPAFRAPDQAWVDEPWPAAGGDLLAPTVRAGRHDGFDRVVVGLTGTTTPPWPGWRAAYTDAPTRDGSGLPAGVAGDSVLEVVLNGMAYPEPGDPVYDGGDFGLDTHALGGVVEVIRTTPFEGQLQVFVGLTGEPRPYRTFLLQDPMRLVIDIRQPG